MFVIRETFYDHPVYSLREQIVGDEMGGTCGTYGRRETHTSFWCGNLIIKDLVRSRQRWVNNIKMEHK
jgi:hypothetical protein